VPLKPKNKDVLAPDNIKDSLGNDFLGILVGEKLSSVTFVLDYLQLDFDGNRFTLNVWPMVVIGNNEYKFGEPSYRDTLCSLIAQVVKQATGEEKQYLNISFESGDMLIVSLCHGNPELIAPEIAIFTDLNDNWYVLD